MKRQPALYRAELKEQMDILKQKMEAFKE